MTEDIFAQDIRIDLLGRGFAENTAFTQWVQRVQAAQVVADFEDSKSA